MESSLFYPVDVPYDIAYRKNSPTEPVSPHSHNAVEIYYTRTALPDVLIEGQLYTVAKDSLIIIPPFCVHQLYHEMGIMYERYVLSIKDTWLKSVLGSSSDVPSALYEKGSVLILPAGNDQDRVGDILDKLLQYSGATSPGALSVLFEFLDMITSMGRYMEGKADRQTGFIRNAPISDSQKRVNEIISYVQNNIADDLNVPVIAEHFHLNPDYLSRLFKSHVHIPLGRFINIQRIAKAQELLREGKSVADTAEELGYSGYAYFFRSFQKIAGISPSRYRTLYKAR